MASLLIRLVINAAAIYVAAFLVDGVDLDTTNWVSVGVVAAVFGIVNAFLKPVLKLLGFPFILLTLGLFALVINAGLFLLTARLTQALTIDGFGAAFWGALVVSAVSFLLGLLLDKREDDD